MERTGKGVSLAFFLICISALPCRAEAPGYPLINRLDSSDTLFRQLVQDVETARRRLAVRERNGDNPASFAESLTVYRYVPGKGEDLLGIAARLNVPYAALAALNRLAHPTALEGLSFILLPSVPGIFVPGEPRSDIERLLSLARVSRPEDSVSVSIAGEPFLFYPGDDFSPTERIFFLNPGFRFPLRNFRITSRYGPRINPVTGKPGLHGGLDLAAPYGTEVYAAAEGIVSETGEDPVYGKYVIIKHGDTWASLYGHLSAVETALRSAVQSGTLIGRVGSTGQSTGPHLHFELRRNGRTQDPGKYLFQTPGQ
jgi:murein DD-endopeptidase MepM/ murein hydrolase activator NlpD